MPYDVAFDPLADSADPRRYVPLETSERALAALTRSVREGLSPALLQGASGVGKTFLLRVLADRAPGLGYSVAFSPFLHLPPDDVARWLLYLLGRLRAPDPSDAELLAEVRAHDAHAVLVIVDEIQGAPLDSVRRLAGLARAAGAKPAVVTAGTPGPDLDARLPALLPRSTVSLPAALPRGQMERLLEAILAHPGLKPELHGLTAGDRASIIRAARGVPGLLRVELVRRAAGIAIGASLPTLEALPELPPQLHVPLDQPEAEAPLAMPQAAGLAGVDDIDFEQWLSRRMPAAAPAPASPSGAVFPPWLARARQRLAAWSAAARNTATAAGARAAALWKSAAASATTSGARAARRLGSDSRHAAVTARHAAVTARRAALRSAALARAVALRAHGALGALPAMGDRSSTDRRCSRREPCSLSWSPLRAARAASTSPPLPRLPRLPRSACRSMPAPGARIRVDGVDIGPTPLSRHLSWPTARGATPGA